MTAIQLSPHGNAQQFSPQASRDIGSRSVTHIQTSPSSQNRPRDSASLSNGTASASTNTRESASAKNGLPLNGNAVLSNSQNSRIPPPNGTGLDGSVESRRIDENSRPAIRRSKSHVDGGVNSREHEIALRNGDIVPDESKDWGARHGFEEHYESEEYVAQLANVSHA